ncbi:hypothetical protein [Falsochrobactrum shanghaiense]|nr:hypothetical protein [Falsochrobactrum shanghaiense]
MQEDTTLTDLQKRMISVIVKHWSNARMAAECSNSFIAVGAGTTVKMVKKYKPSLIASGRVSVKKEHTFTESTLWDVNWFFRGSAYTRHMNGGKPISDCRKVAPKDAQGSPPYMHKGAPQDCIGGWPPDMHGGGPQVGAQFHPLRGCIGAPTGARPLGGAQGVAPLKEKKNNPRAQPGFARWKIVHAEYEGEDEDVFVAHLRSGANRKFVLRCHIESEEYCALDDAIGIDGDTEYIIGTQIAMSVNRTGPKEIRRADPLPWQTADIVSGETNPDGSAIMRVIIDGEESKMRLTSPQAAALIESCGGEKETIGARVRFRLMPDDSMEFYTA